MRYKVCFLFRWWNITILNYIIVIIYWPRKIIQIIVGQTSWENILYVPNFKSFRFSGDVATTFWFTLCCCSLQVCVVQHLSQKQMDTNIGKSTTLVMIYLPCTGRQHSEIVCIKLNENNPFKSHFVSNTIKPIGSITLSSLAEFFFCHLDQ